MLFMIDENLQFAEWNCGCLYQTLFFDSFGDNPTIDEISPNNELKIYWNLF